MKNNKHKLISTATELRETLQTIEDLLSSYDGIKGNFNYVEYYRNKAIEANNVDLQLNQIYDDTYNVVIEKRKGINMFQLIKIVEKLFTLLDDIDTAVDIFKPRWCKITKVVEQLHRLRWIVCYIKTDNNDDSYVMLNGNCYIKDERVGLTF